MPPKHGEAGLSHVPMSKKPVMCLMEKMHVLEKLCAGLRHSTVGCVFLVVMQQNTLDIFKEKHT